MSSCAPRDTNLSSPSTPTHNQAISVNPEATNHQPESSLNGRQQIAETSQNTSGPSPQSYSCHSERITPLIIITEDPQGPVSNRRSRSLVSRHHQRRSSASQPPRRSTTPYNRPRFQSQPRDIARTPILTMSSAASSPGNTTTSGPSGPSTSGSTPGYQLPYAPFPYPMPATTRSSGQQGGNGSGK